jgi:hypothetical protein
VKTKKGNMKKNTVLTFAALTAMTPAELYKLAGEHVKYSDAIDNAKDKFANALKPFAKVVAALKRRYVELREKREIALDVPFKKFFKDNVKGDLPGRAEALAALFNSLVLTLDGNGKPLLSEENFDAAAVDWLEKASAIVKAAQKENGDQWRACDEVLDTVNALSKPGDASKVLRDIRKRQKGEGESTDTENVVSITPALAAQYLCAAFEKANELSEEEQFKLCGLLYDVNDAWAASGIDEATLKRFDEQISKNRSMNVADHIEVISKAA